MDISNDSKTSKLPVRTLILVGLLGAVATAYALVPHQPKADTPSLQERLHGDPEDAQAALIEITAKMSRAQAEELYIRDTNDPNPSLRFAAVDALGNYRDTVSEDVIKRALSDNSADIRESALYSLVKNDKQTGSKMLISALQDSDTQIREDAIIELIALRDRRTVSYLIESLNDPDLSVVHGASGALHEITDQPFMITAAMTDTQRRNVVDHWHTWWSANKSRWPAGSLENNPAITPTRTDIAPDFSLQSTSGQTISLRALQGKIAVLNFWGTWCPPCKAEIPDLVRIDQDYRRKGVEIIGIATDEPDSKTLTDWCAAHNVKYDVAMAPDSVLDSYGNIDEVPVTVIIDRKGQIRYRFDGPRDYNTFKGAIDRLLSE